jgi:hypothetical protein
MPGAPDDRRRASNMIRASFLALAVLGAERGAQAQSGAWLDRPLANWNAAGTPLPRAAFGDESRAALTKRCALTPPEKTAAERALAGAGWLPFWNFDQQLVRGDLEIVGGMTAADGMCRPVGYNLFVFASGRFAGTLSPAPMASRVDGVSGAVRFLADDAITAEFARYTDSDALCCPSSRQTVRFRIDRTGAAPLVVPVDVRTTREF